MVAINSVPDGEPPHGGIELTRPPLPPRSPLVSLRPIGVGTGMVESLWGYLVRLSAAHAVSLRDLWHIVAHPIGIGLGQTPYISLKRERAALLAARLEMLTLRHDVRRTTLVAAEQNSGAIIKTRPTRVWCEACLATDEEPYDRLIWNIGIVTCCSIHSRPLRHHCPACGQPQRLHAVGSRILQCERCRSSLAIAPQHSVALPTKHELWVSREIASFISHFDAHCSDAAAIVSNLESSIKHCGGFIAMARQMRASQNTVRTWHSRTHGMSMDGLLRWAWLTSIPAVDLLCRKMPIEKAGLREPAPPKSGLSSRMPKRLTPNDYLAALANFLKDHPLKVPTRKGIAHILGGQLKAAAAQSPEVIDAFLLARRKRRVAAKRARVWRTVCEVHKAVSWLAKGGRPITSRNITDFFGNGLMRDPIARRYNFSLQQHLNAGRTPPNPNKRLPQDVQAFWKHSGLI